MKLWKKLSLMTIAVLFVVTGISGTALLSHSAQYNEEKTLENYEQQLSSAAQALGRELDAARLGTYSAATKRSYLNYLMKKYGAEQYILLEGGETACNLTPFNLTEPAADRWTSGEAESIIQRTETQYILISGRTVPASGGGDYRLVLVKDISMVYEDIRGQAVLFAAVYLAGALIAGLLVFLFTKKMLAPLSELQHAAEDIRAGKLEKRAAIKTRDEVGIVAEAFNGMAEQIERQVTELSAVSEQRRQMLGSLAHELKTPMTSIIGYADTLLHVKVKEEQRERALLHIYEESRRLERLGSKLMSLIGMYDNDSIHMEKTNIVRLFERVAELEKYHLEEQNLKLQVSCQMEDRALDRDLFESLLVNLIDNAAKASRTGDIIFLTGKDEVIVVQDQGSGIPAAEIDRVTEAFYMVDKARSRKAGGSGLGLALCERIAQLHGAGLTIESEEGKGTRVSIRFGREKFADCLQPAAYFLQG